MQCGTDTKADRPHGRRRTAPTVVYMAGYEEIIFTRMPLYEGVERDPGVEFPLIFERMLPSGLFPVLSVSLTRLFLFGNWIFYGLGNEAFPEMVNNVLRCIPGVV